MGLSEWVKKNAPGSEADLARKAERADFMRRIAEKDASRKAKYNHFGVTLTRASIVYQGHGGFLAGATACVTTAANNQTRVTATRLVTIGLFAFAAKKVSGSVYLMVDNPTSGYQFVVEIPAKRETQAREFAAEINRAAKKCESAIK